MYSLFESMKSEVRKKKERMVTHYVRLGKIVVFRIKTKINQ